MPCMKLTDSLPDFTYVGTTFKVNHLHVTKFNLHCHAATVGALQTLIDVAIVCLADVLMNLCCWLIIYVSFFFWGGGIQVIVNHAMWHRHCRCQCSWSSIMMTCSLPVWNWCCLYLTRSLLLTSTWSYLHCRWANLVQYALHTPLHSLELILSVTDEIFIFRLQLVIVWPCGVMVRMLAHDTKGRGFDCWLFHFQVTTLGKLFTHMCLCQQAV